MVADLVGGLGTSEGERRFTGGDSTLTPPTGNVALGLMI